MVYLGELVQALTDLLPHVKISDVVIYADGFQQLHLCFSFSYILCCLYILFGKKIRERYDMAPNPVLDVVDFHQTQVAMLFMMGSWPVYWYLEKNNNPLEIYFNDVETAQFSKRSMGRTPNVEDVQYMIGNFTLNN